MRVRIFRRSTSSLVSPGPRVPMPPPSRDSSGPAPISRGSRYFSCASSTCSLPSRVRARRAKMSRISCVRSTTLQRQALLQLAQLRRRQLVVEDDEVDIGFGRGAREQIDFAAAEKGRGVGLRAAPAGRATPRARRRRRPDRPTLRASVRRPHGARRRGSARRWPRVRLRKRRLSISVWKVARQSTFRHAHGRPEHGRGATGPAAPRDARGCRVVDRSCSVTILARTYNRSRVQHAVADVSFPLPLADYPARAGRCSGDARRQTPRRAVQRRRHRHFSAGDPAYLRRTEVRRMGAPAAAATRRPAAPARTAAGAEHRRRRSCTSSARSRSSSGCGRSC